MLTVGLITSSRADTNFYLPLLRALASCQALDVKVVATGMHLARRFGRTARAFEAAGFPPHARVASLAGADTPEGVAASIGRGVMGFARLFARWRPDVLIVFGDRFDMIPAALAALPHRIPVAHIAGGELTEGAIDDALRHSLTKLSHLHFVAMDAHRRRLIQMGEEPWRIVVSGSLTLDHLKTTALWTREETARRFGLDLGRPSALVTYHPVTLEPERTAERVAGVLAALDRVGIQCLFTHPNADTAYRQVVAAIERFCDGRADRRLVVNAGPVAYVSLLNTVSVMVGNSSSGLVEAPSFRLPVVNVGARQTGRFCAANVISCGDGAQEVEAALREALRPGFRERLSELQNPYGDGQAAPRIVAGLLTLGRRPDLLRKRFTELEAAEPATLQAAAA